MLLANKDDVLRWMMNVFGRRFLLLANKDDSNKDNLKGTGWAPSNQHRFCLVRKQTSVVKAFIFIHFLEDLFTIVLYSQTKDFSKKTHSSLVITIHHEKKASFVFHARMMYNA